MTSTKGALLVFGLAMLAACGDEPSPAPSAPGATVPSGTDEPGASTTPPPATTAVTVVDGGGPISPSGPTPLRLRLDGTRILDPSGAAIRLRGANLEGVTDAEAAELHDVLHLSFVRLRVSFEGANRDDSQPSHLAPAYRAQVSSWLKALRDHQVWALIEMRTDDATANAPGLYTKGAPDFVAYTEAWKALASDARDVDYVAGYGLLAEPSPDKAKALTDPVAALLDLQTALMDAITNDVHDARTPFFVGPAFNYDAMEYRLPIYYDRLAAYAGRLVYEVNVLQPKPFIDEGLGADGAPATYPAMASPVDLSTLLTVRSGESFGADELEKIFNARRKEQDSFVKLLTPDFFPWYLSQALAFRDAKKVPLLVDQFGVTSKAKARGGLDYERDLIQFAEGHDIHWCRWAYNAGSTERKITGDADVYAFYRDVVPTLAKP